MVFLLLNTKNVPQKFFFKNRKKRDKNKKTFANVEKKRHLSNFQLNR